MMGPTELFVVVVVVVAIGFWISRRLQSDDEYIARWADATGVEITPEQAPYVRRYLDWSRRGRRIGALVGFVSPWLYSAISGRTFDEGAWAVATMLVGYLLGALVAEIVVNRALESGPAAVMQPRRLTDYLPGHLLMWQRALGVVSLAMIVPYAIAQPAEGIDLPGVGSIASYALGGASIAVIVELIERAIVARRQSMADLADVKVDDALRSTSIHVVAAAGFALLIQFVGPLVAITLVAALPEPPAGVVGGVTIVLAFLFSLACWISIARPNGSMVRRGVRSAA